MAIAGMVTSMTCLGMAWYEQVWRTLNCWKEKVILSISDFVTDEELVKKLGEMKHSRKVKA